jgi:hypothetical protein
MTNAPTLPLEAAYVEFVAYIACEPLKEHEKRASPFQTPERLESSFPLTHGLE